MKNRPFHQGDLTAVNTYIKQQSSHTKASATDRHEKRNEIPTVAPRNGQNLGEETGPKQRWILVSSSQHAFLKLTRK